MIDQLLKPYYWHDTETETTHMHPADLDCAQHLELLMTSSKAAAGRGPRLPFAYDEAALRGARREMHPVCMRGNKHTTLHAIVADLPH